jgi:hypothetical protein
MEREKPTHCTATTAAGQTCRAWAVRGTDPPRCAAHGGRRQEGAAETKSPPDLAGLIEQIDDLDERIARLGAYVDAHRAELKVDDLCRLLDLQSKMMGRVTRMRQALTHLDRAGRNKQSAFAEALHKVLDGLAQEWKTEL